MEKRSITNLHIPSLSVNAQTLYADILGSFTTPLFSGEHIHFSSKTVKGSKYWYTCLKLGKTSLQTYLGPDTDETRALMAQEKACWDRAKQQQQAREQMVNSYLALGGVGVTRLEGKVLNILARSGVFLAGGTLVGTPAFRAMANNLGVKWVENTMTQDIDVAADRHCGVALAKGEASLRDSLRDSGLGIVEIPSLNRKHPSTSFSLRKERFQIDVLTPEIGTPGKGPVLLPQLGVYAHPLRYLDYVLEDVEPSVIPFGAGIVVNVPNPARFAVHKIVVSQRRKAIERVKVRKDLNQAEQVLSVLFDTQPSAVEEAYEASARMGPKFNKYLKIGLKVIGGEILEKWVDYVGTVE